MTWEEHAELPLTESTFFILAALVHPRHGYSVMQWAETITEGRVVIGPGTLYGALKAFVKKDWIHELPGDDPRRKVYALSGEGKSILEKEVRRLEVVAKIGREVLAELE